MPARAPNPAPSAEAVGRWLDKACNALWPWLQAVGVKRVAHRISVGYPRGHKGRAVGQAWSQPASVDGVGHVYICPTHVGDTVGLLSTILHELIHISDDCASGHRKFFRRTALAVGFEKPMKSTPPGEALDKKLRALAKKLGPIPYGALKRGDRKRVGSRLKLAMCDACGGKIRGANETLKRMLPTPCGCGVGTINQIEF